jgi:hypothetical protein
MRSLFSRFSRKLVETVKPFERRNPPDDLCVILCDTRRDVVDAWIDHFRDVAAVEIVCGSLLDLRCDVLVSPANSFGDMSGGIDQVIDNRYKGVAQRAVVQRIRETWLGELPVGAALIVATDRSHLPLIVVAPTMRGPER